MIKTDRRSILFCKGQSGLRKLPLLIILLWIMVGQSPAQPSEKPNLVIRFGHSGPVYDASFSPDGRFVVTAGQDNHVILWDAAIGSEIRRLAGHTFNVNQARFSPDGDRILSVSGDGTARIWDVKKGTEIRVLKGHKSFVTSGKWSRDGRLVVTSGWDRTVRTWDAKSGIEIARFSPAVESVNDLALSPDGRQVLLGTYGHLASLWNLQTGALERVFRGHTGDVFAVTFSPDGRLVASGGWDGSVRLWDSETGREMRKFINLSTTFEGEATKVQALAFSPDGQSIAVGCMDHTVRLWVLDTAEEIRRFIGHTNAIESTEFSADGQFLLTGSFDDTARLWEVATGREIRVFEGAASPVNGLAIAGHVMATAGDDGQGQVWDLTTGQQTIRLVGHSKTVYDIDLTADGRIAATGSEDGSAVIWDVLSGRRLHTLEGHLGAVFALDFSDDGRQLATGGQDGSSRTWDVQSGAQQSLYDVGASWIKAIAFTPDGKNLVTGTWRGSVTCWDIARGTAVWRAQNEASIVRSIVVSPDGRYILTGDGSAPNIARIWDATHGHKIRQIDPDGWIINSLAFSSDSRMAITGDAHHFAKLWDVATGEHLRTFAGHAGFVNVVAFSPDDCWVATGSEDGTVRIWDPKTGEQVCWLTSFRDGSWAVADREGRFDTNNLEDIKGLHWIMSDDPMRPLPVEIFMREYYEPRLLPRVLAGEKFKPVRALSELNRVQPKVEIVSVEQETVSSDKVTVTVEVLDDERTFGVGGNQRTWRTGVYDLRLFRDQQLVGYAPKDRGGLKNDANAQAELARWRRVNEIKLDPVTGKQKVRFENIRLPHRQGLESVEFSAYAFNEDRVKSTTARTKCVFTEEKTQTVSSGEECVLQRPEPRKGRAYIIAVGVNAYETADWDLRYAAKDAEKLLVVLPPLLEATQEYASIVKVPLISDWTEGQGRQRQVTQTDATKAKFMAVLDLLAGREIGKELRVSIPNAEQLETAQPEDLVLIAYSSHGYADQSGSFYLFPYDIGDHAGQKVTSDLLKRTISSDELSIWLRDVDAGELVMVIDACHSAASVEGTGFKPGPMGASGLGQLAYDKGMRILASTRADDVAWESPQTKQGLLSYALVQDGLLDKNADFEPKDEAIVLPEWLKYGEKRVPELYAKVRSGQGKGAEGKTARLASYQRGVGVYYYSDDKIESVAQQPSLFDFRRSVAYEMSIMKIGDQRSKQSLLKGEGSP